VVIISDDKSKKIKELQMASGQFKAHSILYLESFKTFQKAQLSEIHQISRNNGNGLRTGKYSGNHTMKSTLASDI